MKALKKISLIFVLFFLYTFVLSRNYLPETIAVKGEEIRISDIEVIPVGEVIGIKLYTSGVLVVGTAKIDGADGNSYKPYENTDIKEGDSIIKVAGEYVNSTEELINIVNRNGENPISINYIRNNNENVAEITPVKDQQGYYKLGLWVRDSAAGVGTMTFYNEQTQTFAALGHPITDIDTGDIIQTSSGEIDDVNIISIIKGKEEEPGKLQGVIQQDSIIGSIYKNTAYGIYGIVKNQANVNMDYNRRMNVAMRQEINLGEATILSDISGELKEYKIEIQKTYLNNNYDNKSMVIKVTDEELLNRTGGIIQGMSGSPVIQNGKFCGAITHVLVP